MAYNVPVVTDATESSAEELQEAVALFFDATDVTFQKADGGVNNKVYYVTSPSRGRFILRVYNNGFNTARVSYEHAVLHALSQHSLPFAIPTLLPTRSDTSHAGIRSGAQVCMFRVIQGGPPSIAAARSMGRSTAALVQVLRSVDMTAVACPNPLYRNMYDAHHAMTRERFAQVVSRPEFHDAPDVRAATDDLKREIERCEALIADTLMPHTGVGLPEQQIHADLHTDNVLCDVETAANVVGVLDFEFTARDWRVMELAVGLSKYLGMKGIDIPAVVTEWVQGYTEGGGKLTNVEMDFAADLIIIRVLSNVIYFAGRAYAGEDDVVALTSRVRTYASRCEWLNSNRTWLRDTLAAHIPVEAVV